MKIQCLDHVAIMVKDMDRAIEFMSKLFELQFEQVAPETQPGMRICISRPDGRIELISVVDPVEAAQSGAVGKGMAKLAQQGYEGLLTVFLRVDDAAATAADAEKLGGRVAFSVDMGVGQLLPFLPKFTEVLFDDRVMPVRGLGLIQRMENS